MPNKATNLYASEQRHRIRLNEYSVSGYDSEKRRCKSNQIDILPYKTIKSHKIPK